MLWNCCRVAFRVKQVRQVQLGCDKEQFLETKILYTIRSCSSSGVSGVMIYDLSLNIQHSRIKISWNSLHRGMIISRNEFCIYIFWMSDTYWSIKPQVSKKIGLGFSRLWALASGFCSLLVCERKQQAFKHSTKATKQQQYCSGTGDHERIQSRFASSRYLELLAKEFPLC